MVRVGSLGTGSGGNAFCIESAGETLLIDCGFSAHDVACRMKASGFDPDSVTGLFLSHEHGDHVKGAATYAIRHRVPVYTTRGTYRFVPSLRRRRVKVRPILAGEAAPLGRFSVTPFAIPHDAEEPVGFIVEVEGRRIGVTTDLGHVSDEVRRMWLTAEVLVVESNHDIDMLRLGPYPAPLKERVASPVGHLSNDALAQFLRERTARPLRRLLLAHLSKVNNEPSLALRTARAALRGSTVETAVAGQDAPSAVIEV